VAVVVTVTVVVLVIVLVGQVAGEVPVPVGNGGLWWVGEKVE